MQSDLAFERYPAVLRRALERLAQLLHHVVVSGLAEKRNRAIGPQPAAQLPKVQRLMLLHPRNLARRWGEQSADSFLAIFMRAVANPVFVEDPTIGGHEFRA